MQNNGHSRKNEKEQRVLEEAWEIVYEAIAKGCIQEACKRIQNITDVTETEAMDIIEYISEAIPKNDHVTPYGAPTQPVSSWKPVKETKLRLDKSIETERNYGVSVARLVLCSACNAQISSRAEACPQCGHPTGIKVCPKCSSTNTKVISGASKATSIFLWGPFAANKVVSKFQCKDCGHKW